MKSAQFLLLLCSLVLIGVAALAAAQGTWWLTALLLIGAGGCVGGFVRVRRTAPHQR
ncbi:hypothetical protein AB0B15_24590 [Streptomyces sp. NPDC045456]|uniref:hypothetical protein n=1 Tax=Streptomyces sp. NPDC045456 TaxID=3155254 RepID=UPI0033C359F0